MDSLEQIIDRVDKYLRNRSRYSDLIPSEQQGTSGQRRLKREVLKARAKETEELVIQEDLDSLGFDEQ